MEFRSEGHILGVGAQMFVVAGPVIVYGTFSSVIVGLIYYLVSRG
jgi:stage V sporulation protein AC